MSTEPDKEAIVSMDKDDERKRVRRLNREEKTAPITDRDASFMEPKSASRADKEIRKESLERSLEEVPEPHSKT